ncbi:MAG: hypothetical protein ACTJHK_01505 [Enterococcus viikkiensis]|uniref:Uncharacterized protein n=1 Tax=Enterococcus viikkiensis TaxID=930854 RepID=A0ABU3FLW2_9ENTE|nr:hypothetical protein [Enterococcus viikkiensis]MDT2826965.1 hypothetical protein [Enterococcus viikkiensis]
MPEKINLTLRVFLVLVIILGTVSAQFWTPEILGIDLLELSTESLILINLGMGVIIFLILGRPIHFIWTALKRK